MPGSRRRRAKAVIWSLVGVLLVTPGLGGVVIWQNSYDIREERVVLRHGGGALDGVLATPKEGRGPYGLVVFVHGDGPVDATHDTFYRPLWESFARAGYASLSWSKPGVGGSSGNWLDQSMEDRVDETMDAISWARQRPDIDSRRIGLWGASQAGWVLPKVAARTPGLRFVIAVSPAVNWQQQGRYHLLAQMREDGASAEQVEAALRRREITLQLASLMSRNSVCRLVPESVGDHAVLECRAEVTAFSRGGEKREGGSQLAVDRMSALNTRGERTPRPWLVPLL
ncbi:alpha/beta hydrolase [Streptomyces sp. NBC_01142]|uniref:alpha/beta hydrolase family protein n=1 Tax=Streptomyces sp. NBC_01142 TaxID=2975865 RepID=UPI002254A39F|nr:CocE/NonD family hydrolase [Streptomyces sp. NBC_01142]MCX4827111.1 alpha/beta hydrolase [Streptomyces sp. NBC_01142]